MSHMSGADFEERYRREGDPWGYETSSYERAKYDATLAACGEGPFGHALELGASIGVLSARLAKRCRELVTIDAAPTAVRDARRRLDDNDSVQVILGTIPQDIPKGPYDLVVASEILYYLEADPLAVTLARIREETVPGARLVAVHWRPPGDERPATAAEVHERLRSEPWLEARSRHDTDDYLLDVLVRR